MPEGTGGGDSVLRLATLTGSSLRRIATFPLVLGLFGCPPGGGSDKDLATLNIAPVATIISHGDGDSVVEGDVFTLVGSVSDADNSAGDLVGVWLAGSRELCGAGDSGFSGIASSGETTCETSLSLGEGPVALQVRDPSDALGTATVELVVAETGAPNQPPTCSILSPDDGANGVLGATVQFLAALSDPESPPDSLTAEWRSDLDGNLGLTTVEPDGASELSLDLLSFGTHVVTLTGTDVAGATCSDSVVFTVGGPPEVSIDAPSDGDTYNEGENVTFVGLVYDSGTSADALSVMWESDLDGELDTTAADATGQVTFDASWLSAGDHTISLWATDADGLYGSAAILLTINGLPSTPDVAILPVGPGTLDDLVATLATPSTDPEGDPITYSYAWWVDGVASGYTTETVPNSATTRDQVWEVVVTPNDGWADGSAGWAAVTIANSTPTLVDVSLSPSVVAEGDVLVCTPGVATDADGDNITYTYAWTVDGTGVSASSSTLGDTWWNRDETVVCWATPDDGRVSGVAVASNAITVANSAPSITSVSISPDPAFAGDVLLCEAVGFADADSDGVSTRYEWWLDGAAIATTAELATSVVGGNELTCTATPFDGTDVGPALSASLTLSNSPPELSGVSISPAVPVGGDDLSCDLGVTTDPDGTTAFIYTYAWTIGGGFVAETGPTLAATEVSRGDAVRCYATPNDGTEDGETVASSLVSAGNAVPAMVSVSIAPSTAYEGDTFTCTAAATDADGDTVSYAYVWYVDGGVVAETGDSLSSIHFSRGNSVYCAATPTDTLAEGTSMSSVAVVVSNSVPSVLSLTLTPEIAGVESLLTCAPVAGDADNDSVSFAYVWYVNGAPVAAATETLAHPDFGSGDAVYCAATPDDGLDIGPVENSAVVTISNSAPTMTSVSLSPVSADETSTLTCSPAASDVDGDSVHFAYAWYVDSSVIASTTSTLTGASFNAGNSVYCRVTPNDGTDAGPSMDSAAVTIANTAPSVSSVSLTPSTASEGDTLTCSPTGSDPDGDSILYSYAWYVDSLLISASNATLSGTDFASGNTVQCRVTPSDAAGSGSAVSSSTVTISNSAPVMTSVGLTPSAAYEASTLTCAPAATDINGTSPTFTYAWYVDSSLVAPTTSTLGGTYFSSGNTVYCLVTPSDGTASGAAMSSSTITIGNTAPVMVSVSVSPGTAYEASTLTCTPSATDADGTTPTFTYAWYVDSSLVAPTTATLTGTYFSKNSAVYCSATASDGTTTSGAMASTPITISNTAPVLASVTLSPTLAYTNDTLTATPASSDADGDSVSDTYAWYVNGTLIAPTTATLSGATYFSKGDTVYARVTPSDGTTSGTAVSSSTLTIGNTAPTAPVAEIDPADPEDGLDPLVCAIDSSATDEDGDTLTYAFTWTVDGSEYTGDTDTATTSTVPAAATDGGDVWICTIKASDGTTTGSGGTATVTVLGASYTIGYASVFASPGTGSAAGGYSLGHQITVSSAVQLYQLGTYMRLADSDSVRMALYTNASGAPGNLVAYTALTSMSGYPAGSFIEMDVVGAPVSVTAGTYWLMMNLSGTAYMGYTTSGATGNIIYYKSLASSTAFPSSWGSGATYTGQFLNAYMVVR